MKKLLSIFLIAAVLAGLLTGCGSRGFRSLLGIPPKIALIAQTAADASGLALEAGAKRASAEFEAELVNLSPAEQDSALQAAQIRQAVSENCDAIVIAYRQSAEVMDALREAAEAGLALVYVDTAEGSVERTIYATDHHAAGRKAGEAMLEMLEVRRVRSGIIGVIGVNQRDAAALQRESGFREVFQGKNFAIVETRYDAKNPIRARNIAQDYISRGVSGIFAVSEISTAGAGNAVRELDDDAVVIGFGQSEEMLALMDAGYVRGTLNQNYDAMGYGAVKAAVSILKGEAVAEDLTDTGVTLLESSAPLLRISDLRLALITPDRVEHYWKELEEGAVKASQELGCKLVNLSPTLGDESAQVQRIRQAVASGYYGIISASGSSDTVASAIEEAKRAGLVVICVDHSSHKAADAVVAEDHREVGRMAAKAVLEKLTAGKKEKGEIGIIGVSEDDEEALQREAGFREAFEGTAYTLLETRYCEGDAARAHSLASDMVVKGADAIFGCSEGATIGVANGVMETKRKVVVVGYGRSEAIGWLLEEELVQALMEPHPDTTGYDAVKTACAMILGEDLPESE